MLFENAMTPLQTGIAMLMAAPDAETQISTRYCPREKNIDKGKQTDAFCLPIKCRCLAERMTARTGSRQRNRKQAILTMWKTISRFSNHSRR